MGEKARRAARDALLIAGLVILAVFLIKKLFFLLFPVGMGYLFSEAVRSSFKKLKPVSPPVRRILIVLILLILFALLLLAATLAMERALWGVRTLAEGLEGTVATLGDWLRTATEQAGKWLSGLLHRDVETAVAQTLTAMLTEGSKQLAQRLPEWVGAIAGSVPALLAFLALFLFSGYYFSCAWEQVRALFFRLCPAAWQSAVLQRKAAFLMTLKRMLRGYGLLFLITFSELLFGLLLLRVPGAPGLAFATALVDALPILGCGTVLVPWAVILLLQKKTARGIGLLILYGVILVARQFIEPRIVGRSIGLHPIVSLILMLGGFALFGVWGLFLLPLGAACFLSSESGTGKTKETPS